MSIQNAPNAENRAFLGREAGESHDAPDDDEGENKEGWGPESVRNATLYAADGKIAKSSSMRMHPVVAMVAEHWLDRGQPVARAEPSAKVHRPGQACPGPPRHGSPVQTRPPGAVVNLARSEVSGQKAESGSTWADSQPVPRSPTPFLLLAFAQPSHLFSTTI
jgi:hypothetical protein